MMKFKNYLNEEAPIKKDQLFDLLKTDYSEAFYAYRKKNIIYRGMKNINKSFALLKPNKERKSVNTLNFYTVIINEHPSWKEFPKRNVICTFDLAVSHFYGIQYIVFPKNGTKIGICPKQDIWGSWDVSASYMNTLLWKMYADPNNPTNSPDASNNPKNLNDVKDICRQIEENVKTYSIDEKNGGWKPPKGVKRLNIVWAIWRSFDMYFNIEEIKKGKSLFDEVISFFSPKDFKTENIADIKSNYRSEVWFDSPYLVLKNEDAKILKGIS